MNISTSNTLGTVVAYVNTLKNTVCYSGGSAATKSPNHWRGKPCQGTVAVAQPISISSGLEVAGSCVSDYWLVRGITDCLKLKFVSLKYLETEKISMLTERVNKQIKTDAAVFPKWLITKYQSMPHDN